MYFITAICSSNPIHSHRTFGYFKSLIDAVSAINNNSCNMHESYYDYLICEEINEGIHGQVVSEIWFEWYGKDGWVSCHKPEWAIGRINWAIG